jgi:hypothetical protein
MTRNRAGDFLVGTLVIGGIAGGVGALVGVGATLAWVPPEIKIRPVVGRKREEIGMDYGAILDPDVRQSITARFGAAPADVPAGFTDLPYPDTANPSGVRAYLVEAWRRIAAAGGEWGSPVSVAVYDSLRAAPLRSTGVDQVSAMLAQGPSGDVPGGDRWLDLARMTRAHALTHGGNVPTADTRAAALSEAARRGGDAAMAEAARTAREAWDATRKLATGAGFGFGSVIAGAALVGAGVLFVYGGGPEAFAAWRARKRAVAA